MQFLAEYGLFLLKAITVVISVGLIVAVIASAGRKNKPSPAGSIEVTNINDRLTDMADAIKYATMDKKAHKEEEKKARKEQKKLKKAKTVENKKRVFLLEFDGDVKASAVDQLRETISSILLIANEQDEVVLRLESAGGMVHSYGLASSQLDRIRQKNIPLTVCVDKVAASGGYMMACVANKICAAPFAILGSIGVVAQLPNFHRLLKKNNVDFELFTAGEYKRTVTMFGENTDKGREKFEEDLEQTHTLFKDFVSQQRPSVNIAEVATGEIWFGTQALDIQLIDQIITSDDYVNQLTTTHDVYQVDYTTKKTLPEKMGLSIQKGVEHAFTRLLSHLGASRFFH